MPLTLDLSSKTFTTDDVKLELDTVVKIAILAAGSSADPGTTDESLASTAGATLSASANVDITVDSNLTQIIPAGSYIYWSDSTANKEIRSKVAVEAAAGQTTITLAPDPTAPTIEAAATATWNPFYTLANVTNASFTAETDTEVLTTYASSGGYQSERPTTASASIELELYKTPLDPGFLVLQDASLDAPDGVRLYVELTEPIPEGGTAGQITEGVATVTGGLSFSQENLTFARVSTTLSFQGKPTQTPAY